MSDTIKEALQYIDASLNDKIIGEQYHTLHWALGYDAGHRAAMKRIKQILTGEVKEG